MFYQSQHKGSDRAPSSKSRTGYRLRKRTSGQRPSRGHVLSSRLRALKLGLFKYLPPLQVLDVALLQCLWLPMDRLHGSIILVCIHSHLYGRYLGPRSVLPRLPCTLLWLNAFLLWAGHALAREGPRGIVWKEQVEGACLNAGEKFNTFADSTGDSVSRIKENILKWPLGLVRVSGAKSIDVSLLSTLRQYHTILTLSYHYTFNIHVPMCCRIPAVASFRLPHLQFWACFRSSGSKWAD